MRRIKLLVVVLSFLVSSVIAGYAEEAGQEPAPVNPEVKQNAVSAPETTQQAATPAAKPEEKQEGHDGGAVKEKLFVAAVGADGVQHVEITGGEYYFDPNHIVVKVNIPVELKVRKGADSSWIIPHDIVVKSPEAGIDFKVALKKEQQSIKFTPTKAGKYALYCDKKSPFGKTHRAKGMEGVIEVVE